MQSKVDTWLSTNLPFVLPSKLVSVHLDNLLKENYRTDSIVDLAKLVFKLLLDKLLELNMPVQLLLVIPLISDEKVLKANYPKNLEDLGKMLDDFEPPEVFLINWDDASSADTSEEYKCPLPFSLFEQDLPNIYVYYREYRYPDVVANEWEFSRAIYIRYYQKL